LCQLIGVKNPVTLPALARPWFPAAVLAAGLSLTVFAAYYAWRTVELRNSSQFELTAQHTRADIERSLEAYVALLRGVAGFFAADTNVTPTQFNAFVHRLRLSDFYPGIQGIGFSERVPVDQEDAFVAKMLALGRTNFQIWPKLPRQELHTITLLEPETPRNVAAIGFDMFTDPIRRRAMELACNRGRPAASGKVTLVQEIDEAKQSGFLIYTPVYEDGQVPETVEERRRLLKGFAYCPFRMGDFVLARVNTKKTCCTIRRRASQLRMAGSPRVNVPS
jgi:CHASE1-domain containing sensor protein